MNDSLRKATERFGGSSQYGFLFKMTAMALAMALVVLGAGVALADDIQNNIQSGGPNVREVVRGGTSISVKYWIDSKNDPEVPANEGCNATSASPVRVTVNAPSGVSATSSNFESGTTLRFDDCGSETSNSQTVAFAATATAPLGDNRVTHAHTDDVNNYYTNRADFDLRVMPRPASGLAAAADGTNAIDLSWTASADAADITDYVIYRSGTQVATASKTATTAEISGLTAATEYCYSIRARYTNASGAHFLSAAAAAPCATTASVSSNTAPTVAVNSSTITVDEGTQASNSGTWGDNVDASLSASIGTVTKNPNGNAGTWSWSYTPPNETPSAGTIVTITATDGPGLTGAATFTLIANNVAPTTPGTPSVPSGTSPSKTGAYTVSWTGSTDVAADTVTYALEHKNDTGEWSQVATGLTSASYTFGGSNASEGEGSWKYRVKASDGTAASSYSSESASVLVDKTLPSIAISATKSGGGSYTEGAWTNKDVTVTFTCEDSGSGVNAAATNVTGSDTFTATGTATSGGTCVDNAGNSVAAEDFPTFDVSIDKTAPTISATATKTIGSTTSAYTENSWTNATQVNVSYTCADNTNGSGIETTYADSDEVTAEGESMQSSSIACTDRAGNTAAAKSFGVKIDRTAPAVTISVVSDSDVITPTETGTDVTWSADESGTYRVLVGTGCADTSAVVVSGPTSYTASTTSEPNEITTSLGLTSLTYGSNGIYVCVVDVASNTGSASRTVGKRAATSVLYTGSQIVYTGTTTTFVVKAQLSSSNTAACTVGGTTVSFTLDDDPTVDGVQAWAGADAVTNSSGVAELSLTGPFFAGIYEAQASFAGTDECAPSTDGSSVTVASPGDSASGGGWYTLPNTSSGSGRVNFGFTVNKVPNTTNVYKGQILVMNQGKWRLKGGLDTYAKNTTSGAASGSGNLFKWNATTLTWDLHSTVTYTINVTDGGSGGKKAASPDKFGIKINSATSTLPNSSPIDLKGGDIKVN